MISHFTIVAFIPVVLKVLTSSAFEYQPLCCDNKSISVSASFIKCENGRNPLHSCKDDNFLFQFVDNQEDETINKKSISVEFGTDEEGKFVTSYGHDLKVYSPHYCFGNETHTKRTVIIYCSDQRNGKASKSIFGLINLVEITMIFLFIVSALLSAITACIYFIVPKTQNIEGKCTFHQTLLQSLFSLSTAYIIIALRMNLSLFDQFCITHIYLYLFIIMSFLTWSTVVIYHIRRRFRENVRTNESKLIYKYLMVGYGIPGLLLVLCNIHAHGYSLITKSDFETSCLVHGVLLMKIYAIIPSVAIDYVCIYFFITLQRQLWKEQPNSPHSTSLLNKLKFRLLLNAKLFAFTGLPLPLFLFMLLPLAVKYVSQHLVYLGLLVLIFISCQGIFTFYLLVISRQRVYRSLIEKWGFNRSNWEPCPESEESSDESTENKTEHPLPNCVQ